MVQHDGIFFHVDLTRGIPLIPRNIHVFETTANQRCGSARAECDIRCTTVSDGQINRKLSCSPSTYRYVIAWLCTGIGAIGMIWLWWRWQKNYVWIVNRIFV